MNEKERILRLGLSLVKGIGPRSFIHLLSEFGSIERVCSSSHDKLSKVLGQRLATLVYSKCYENGISEKLRELEKKSVDFVVFGEPDYPKILEEIYDPPPVIYYKGNVRLLNEKSFSIVGTRKSSSLGDSFAKKFSGALAAEGFCIVSGMAFGIDSSAHQAALEVRGNTIAVLGSPIDKPMPASNFKLFERIVREGLVISEYPMGYEIKAAGFPRRNRIISGLSMGTLIVEAPERSGALITAGCAIDQNREIFAVPWSPLFPNGRGCNELIRDAKAKLVMDIEDILNEFSLKIIDKKFDNKTIIDKSRNNSELENRVLGMIRCEPRTADGLSVILSLEISKVSAVLSQLELKGQTFRDTDGLWKGL